tara:strand:- start:479 stop:1090 length:612 start_codon:yes stop_codon:yes gene_type:complete
MSGYIKLYRKILDNGVFENGELLKVFVWCLLRANTKPKTVFGRKLKAGQFVTGRNSASQELNIPPTTVYDRLMRLKDFGYIKLDSNTKNTVVTVVKFRQYQSSDTKVPKKGIQERFNEFYDEVMLYSHGHDKTVLGGFISYWTEKNKSKTKMRFEMQQVFEISKRLQTWQRNIDERAMQKTPNKVQEQITNWQKAQNIINGQD